MLKALIRTLVESTEMSNAEIHKFLNRTGTPCSKRSVRRHANPIRREIKGETKLDEQPKILLFDIETAPMEVYMWSLWQQGVSPDNVIKDWSILTFAYKWLFDPEITSYKVSPKEAIEREDASIIKNLWSVLDEAQIVVGHNSKKFDHRKANARFALYGLTPPMPYRIIDTMQVAKNKFALSSYKMDIISSLN